MNEEEEFFEIEERNRKVYGVEEIISRLGCGLFQVFVFVFCGIWFLVEACELMILSLLMPTLRRRWELTRFQETLIASVILFGVVFGGSIFGFISDRFGRKVSITIAACTTLLFGTASAFCDNYYLFLCIRFFVGVCVGSVIIPYSLFLEYLPLNRRGLWVLLSGCWGIGSVYEAILGWVILPNFGDRAWQFYIGFSLLPLLISFPMLCCLPESLRFLSLRCEGRNRVKNERKMKKIIRRMERWNFRKVCEEGDDEFDIEFVPPESHKKNFFSELLGSRGLFLMFVNLVLFNVGAGFMYYSFMLITPDLFENKNEGIENQNYMYLSTLLNASMELVTTFFLLITITVFRRKTIFSVSFALAGLSLLILALPFEKSFVFMMVLTFITRMFISSGGTMSSLLSQESLPTNVRGRGYGLSYSISKFCSSFAPFVAKLFSNEYVSMAVLCGISFLTAFFAAIHPKETKLKSLVEVFKLRNRSKESSRPLISLQRYYGNSSSEAKELEEVEGDNNIFEGKIFDDSESSNSVFT